MGWSDDGPSETNHSRDRGWFEKLIIGLPLTAAERAEVDEFNAINCKSETRMASTDFTPDPLPGVREGHVELEQYVEDGIFKLRPVQPGAGVDMTAAAKHIAETIGNLDTVPAKLTGLCAPADSGYQNEIHITNFQRWVQSRWGTRKREVDLAVMTLGLLGEITEVMEECHNLAVAGGHVSEHIKKEIRGSKAVDPKKLTLELGDVQHYLCALANHYGISMADVLAANVDKLTMRERNTEPGKSPPPMGDGQPIHPMAR